jgi:hypothetical protein
MPTIGKGRQEGVDVISNEPPWGARGGPSEDGQSGTDHTC